MLASDQEKTAAVMHRRKHIAIVLCVFLICFYVFTEQLFWRWHCIFQRPFFILFRWKEVACQICQRPTELFCPHVGSSTIRHQFKGHAMQHRPVSVNSYLSMLILLQLYFVVVVYAPEGLNTRIVILYCVPVAKLSIVFSVFWACGGIKVPYNAESFF